MTHTLRAEWTKLRTQRGTLVALASTCVLMVGMTAFFASASQTDATFEGSDDVVQLGLAGIVFAQLAVVVAGASLITSEFGSGMIRTTLTATQGRLRVLLSKAVILSIVVLPLALLSSVVAFVITQPLLHDRGYVAPAYPPVGITDPAAARAVVGTGLLLTAYALIALGIGTILRHSGATIAAGSGLLFLPFLFVGGLPERLAIRVEQFTPLAGMAIQSTTGRMLSAFDGGDRGMPIGPWPGLGVAFAWALGFLAIAFVALRNRDA
jgi:ABC-2 type transport system permease protein